MLELPVGVREAEILTAAEERSIGLYGLKLFWQSPSSTTRKGS